MKSIHIVASLYPYPPKFGVASEIFHSIKSLKETGVKVYLHTVHKHPVEQSEQLNSLCEKVFTYHQKRIWTTFNLIPEIVYVSGVSRLIKNLIQIDAPILFEGIESCFFLKEPTLKTRYKIVRLDKITSKYYLEKGRGKSKLHKWFYEEEAKRFKNFEKVLVHANLILTLSPNDYLNYNSKYQNKVFYLPSFHAEKSYRVPEGLGTYCLFHARLDKKINHDSAKFLIQQVFSELPFQLIISGNGANKELRKLISDYPNIELMENLNEEEIRNLVKNSQINCIPAIESTGMKQFLLHQLFNGRHLISSENCLDGLGFDQLYYAAKNPYDWQTKINEFMSKQIDEGEFMKRYIQLNLHYNNRINAEILYGLILQNNANDKE